MTDFQPIVDAVRHGRDKEIKDMVQKALEDGSTPAEIIDDGLIAGMNVVGRLFKADEMFIPEVLLSARTMHAGMAVLEPLLGADDLRQGKKIVFGTVKGDLHDIGKIIDDIESINYGRGVGYEVLDIGVDQPAERFIETLKQSGASVVAMSALLTTTMPQMGIVIEKIKEQGLRDRVKIIVGGAPVSEKYAESIGADGYAPDAGSAVDLLNRLLT